MSKEYGKVFKGKLVRLYNEDEFNLEMSYLHLNFEGGPNNKSFIDNLIATYNHEYVDEFIKWYTERYHVSGKQYVTGFTGFQHQNKDGDWVDTIDEIPKRQSSEYVKLLKRDKDNNALNFIPNNKTQCENWKEGYYKFKALYKDAEFVLDNVKLCQKNRKPVDVRT